MIIIKWIEKKLGIRLDIVSEDILNHLCGIII